MIASYSAYFNYCFHSGIVQASLWKLYVMVIVLWTVKLSVGLPLYTYEHECVTDLLVTSLLLIGYGCYGTDICLSLDSMNEIIDKYSTHSKNLGKVDQPSLDLNVIITLFPSVMLASKVLCLQHPNT